MGKTAIEWTEETWNPVRGCTPISPGCKNCYAMRQAYRSAHPGGAYEGLVQLSLRGPVWSGAVRLVPRTLTEPLHWKKPRTVFVNSMSDLFHEGFTNEEIAAVFGVMAATPQHTYQVLTKREARLEEWFAWLRATLLERDPRQCGDLGVWSLLRDCLFARVPYAFSERSARAIPPWPLPNVILGVSVEDQRHADLRVPALLRVPAAARMVSYEPALGPVVFRPSWILDYDYSGGYAVTNTRLDWIIVGGESGPGARPFDIGWAEAVVRQCKDAGVACFVKQLGTNAYQQLVVTSGGSFAGGVRYPATGKGGDMQDWPAHLRVREMPTVHHG